MDEFIDHAFPIVLGHFDKVSDLRYSENIMEPKSVKEWINRDLLFVASLFLIKVGFRQYWLPLFINLAGGWTGTTDENGNNFDNFLILYWEQEGVWGLAKYYNLFNKEGWRQMQKDLIWRNLAIWTGWEPWIILWKLYVNGTLYAGDFEEGTGETTSE